ncbi:MAG: hypothetical protein ICV77_16105 [Cyanobacteria bacterium Co-bin8]|nr:hypothetical protein [Cyanobacteria bacterium Co-bin8]
MKARFSSPWSKLVMLGGLLGLLGTAPALAQNANFEAITLGGGSSTGSAQGHTSGFFTLSNIAGRDRSGNICAGFAASTPDHILTLQQDFSSLTVQVNSGGSDTTLLIQGPTDNEIRCGDDTDRRNLDASVQDSNFRAGTYRIWVGTHDQGQRHNYTLTVGQ